MIVYLDRLGILYIINRFSLTRDWISGFCLLAYLVHLDYVSICILCDDIDISFGLRPTRCVHLVFLLRFESPFLNVFDDFLNLLLMCGPSFLAVRAGNLTITAVRPEGIGLASRGSHLAAKESAHRVANEPPCAVMPVVGTHLLRHQGSDFLSQGERRGRTHVNC